MSPAPRASTLGRICVDHEPPPSGTCFQSDGAHEPNPQWLVAEDGVPFTVGDRLFNYYDGEWGHVVSEPDDMTGWFDFQPEGSKRTHSLNSVRVATKEPRR